MEQVAQVPEQVLTKGADRLLDYGVLGLVVLILLVLLFFLGRALLNRTDAMIKTATETATANATVIANNTVEKQRMTEALDDVKDELKEVKARLDQMLWGRRDAPPAS
jgi:Tfp pilus assembly protein PilO